MNISHMSKADNGAWEPTGSSRLRRFFSFFGIRSARMERERSESGDQDDAE